MTNPDLVLLQTQRLTDNANGGGQMTSTIVPDNQANNLFGPISRINRADGNVSLRKAIIKALSADTATYFGAHVIIAAPPSNPGVTSLLFSTGSWTDVRKDAVERVESYLVQGPQTRLWPFGSQVLGQRSIIAYQPLTDALPNVGDSYVIVNQDVVPNVVQFVRLTSVSNVVASFTDTQGTFQLNVVTMGISEPLTSTFPGAEAQRYSTPAPPSIMCVTNAANAATYYGVQQLQTDAASGDQTASLTSIFSQLVPSTQGEVPITDASPTGAQSLVAAATAAVFIFRASSFLGTSYTGIGLMPGTIEVINDFGSLVGLDDGAGNVYSGTSITSGTKIGLVDYASGRFDIDGPFTFAANVHAIPGVAVTQSGFSSQQPVTEATRGYIYTAVLDPLPSPKTVSVSYRALGRWYTLTDDGSGRLVGPVGAGSGAVRFDTGAAVATTGALPDVGSNVIFSWGQAAQYDVRTGDVNIAIPAVSLQLTNPAKPFTVTITWVVAGVTKTVTDNGSGVLSGDGHGSMEYGSGKITLYPTALPAVATGFSAAYQINPATNDTFHPTLSGADISITLSSAPVAPHSILISYLLIIPQTFPNVYGSTPNMAVVLHDDGAGGLIDGYGNSITGSSVNYTTGVATFDPSRTYIISKTPSYATASVYAWDPGSHTWNTANIPILTGYDVNTATIAFQNGTAVNVTSTAAGATSTAHTDNFPTPPITVDLTPQTNEAIVPGTVMFGFAGDTYFDRNGSLYRAIDHSNNAGTVAGSIDYSTGLATITSWITGGSQTLSVAALLCQFGNIPIAAMCSRVPAQSIRPSSFIIQANRKTDGALITATADSVGDWSTANMTGHIDVSTGVFTVRFGQLVLDSSLTTLEKAEPWYNAANIDGTGHIWHPNEALAGSIRYSCVALTTLPLDAGVLGLDPVRLPSDGRVQTIAPAMTLVFRNPLTFTFTGTVSDSSTTSLPRGSLESAVLYDSNGVQVDIGLYTADLAAGSITIGATADLTPYTQPFVCTHTRGEMVLCTDVQITGEIAFSPALVNSYPAASSFVSSALIGPNAGNLQADYDTLFTQTTWNFNPTTLWEDVVQGSSPTAAFDDVDFPIQVLDQDTITQRVALIFTSSTGGNIAFEELGIIGTFNTSTNVAPLNPATGNPIFVMDHRGFGSGYANGNAIRFNLRGAGFPAWFIRSVQVGASATLDDSFLVELRWDR